VHGGGLGGCFRLAVPDRPVDRVVLVDGGVGVAAHPAQADDAGLAAAGLAYDLLTLPHQMPAAIDTVRAQPGLTFVLDHLSKPPIASAELRPWALLVRELAALPNVSCKLSGMITEAGGPGWTVADLRPYAGTVLDAFGPSRVMFGSDWPVCLLAASYADVVSAALELTAELTQDEQAQVFGGTAARAYGLPEAGHEGSPGLPGTRAGYRRPGHGHGRRAGPSRGGS
jgi:predicted TIM-barrel fold metal-dependent hydrolase